MNVIVNAAGSKVNVVVVVCLPPARCLLKNDRVVVVMMTVEQVMLSVPQTLNAAVQSRVMAALVDVIGVPAVCILQQSLLALHSYRTASGVIVDIGQRIEIVPVYEGHYAWCALSEER